uniref:tRNA (adenine(58)-N(1))-methyltransferase non-catalytic subunit TRM6 n=1 Tax=Steinernema glaseri TaxID=37863 RepID=A0A1I7ZL69_9BILA
MAATDVINAGDYVVVQKLGGEHLRIVKIEKKMNILIEKLRFMSDGALGQRFGLFSVAKLKLTPAEYEPEKPQPAEKEEPKGPSSNESTDKEDGRTAVLAEAESTTEEAANPAQSRQKLTQDEILQMKGAGTDAKELVSKLVDGSTHFSERTQYAKSKYIRKKRQKHSSHVLLLRPTVRMIAQSYYLKDPERICNLRIDQLSHILTLCGARSGLNVMVFEQTLGLITAGIIERMGGKGRCVHLHRGQIAQSIPCYQSLHRTPEMLETFYPLRISTLMNNGVQEEDPQEPNYMEMEKQEDKEAAAVTYNKKVERLAKERRAWEMVVGDAEHPGSIDALVLACRNVDPLDVLEKTYNSLQFSGTVVLYSSVAEPLVKAYNWLRERGAVNLFMSDAFYRTHQVLPNSTHPLMQQMITSGFVLSGIKVKVPTE